MKILLIGEFSGLHSDLSAGLIKNGHNVTHVAYSDGYKKIPVQINIDSSKSGIIGKIIRRFNAFKISFQFVDYDVVQVINPWVFGRFFPYKWFYLRLKSKNKKLFFLSAGNDAFFWKNHKKRLDYSPIDDMIQFDKGNNHSYMNTPKSYRFNKWCVDISNGIIPVTYDYYISYLFHPKRTKIIPLPINSNKVKFYGIKNKKQIHIFHGLNRRGVKGTHYIEKAFEILHKKYPNKFKTSIKGNLPFDEYIKVLEDTDIFIDQTSSYSQGMSGLYSMAMGKVVLGGAEPESSSKMYNSINPAINIKPDPKQIVSTIENLVKDKQKLFEISKCSRKFIEIEHDYIKISEKYIKNWNDH